MTHLKRKLIMTLVALLALTTQAWAKDVYVVGNGTGNWLNGEIWASGAAGNKMTEQNGVYSITFTNVDANPDLQFKFAINGSWAENYGCSSTTEIKLNKIISNIEDGDNIMFGLTEPADVTISFNLSERTFMISTNGMKVGGDTHPVPLTRGTGDKINEWTLTNGMPAGNVLLTVAYKDRVTMALTYGGTPITAEANAVTAFKGCEQEFAEALTAAVQNIEPTFSDGDAVDVTATLAADFTFKSSDAAIIGFKSGETYAAEGTLDQMEFRALTTSPVTLTVTYKGTDDLESKSQALLVTIEKKTYTVSLADNTEDADSWKGKKGDGNYVNLPITKLDEGDAVTLKYNGRLKVKSVTATTDAGPAATLQSLTIAKGSTELSEDKVLYYMPGDTYRQALARTENQSTGGLGWGYWEDSSLTTLFFKEVTTKAWDVAIDGDSNFGSGKGTCTITLDTEINPTGHTFQFVATQ